MKKILTLALTASISLASFVPAFAYNYTINRDNWFGSYMTEWCWAATGRNLVVALDVDIAEENREEKEEELYLYVKNVVDNSSYLFPNSNDSIPSYVPDAWRKYYKYNVGAGLRDTVKIAELAAADNGINIEFNYSSRALPFSSIKSDIRDELPVAAWLSKNGTGSSDHIVMFNGARNTSSNNEQLRVYDPAQGQAWVLYDDLIDGTCSALKNRIYDSTVYCE